MYLYTENNPCQLYLSDLSVYEDLVAMIKMIKKAVEYFGKRWKFPIATVMDRANFVAMKNLEFEYLDE